MYALTVTAIGKAQEAELDRINYQAWTTAALSRAKRMPELRKLLSREREDPRTRKHKGWKAQQAAWEAFLGAGSKKRKGKRG